MGDRDAKTRGFELLSEMVGGGGDLGTMDEALPLLTAYLREFAAPEFVCVMAGAPPSPPRVFPGVEGLAAAWGDWGETFETVRVRLERVLQSHDSVVLLVDQIAVTRHEGVEMSQPSAMVWKYDGERIVRLEFHLDPRAALQSAGLA